MTVMTNGVLDIIHPGHVKLLNYCRHLAGKGEVIVALNSDESVRGLKPGRPINSFTKRQAVLLAMRDVDRVVLFDNEQALMETIEHFKPDYLVKGPGTPSKEKIDLLAKWGGKYLRIEGTDDSTTKIIERIRGLP